MRKQCKIVKYQNSGPGRRKNHGEKYQGFDFANETDDFVGLLYDTFSKSSWAF